MISTRTRAPEILPIASRLQARGLFGAVVGLHLGLCAVAAGPALAVPALGVTAALTDADAAETSVITVQATTNQKPHINIGKVVLVEPASETPIPIQVGPIDAIPRNSFVRIRGMPATATLSEGHSIAPGAWAIPLAVLPNLRVSLPVGVSGKSDVTIALVQIDGTVLAEATTSLIIAAAALIAPDQPTPQARERSVASVGSGTAPLDASPPPAGRPPLPSAPSPSSTEPPPLTQDQQRALPFVVRGRAQVQAGNIAAARLFFQRAADAGLADGALALAGTYDPAELSRMRVAGVQPDLALARRWYEKARELGANEAEERLRQLGAK